MIALLLLAAQAQAAAPTGAMPDDQTHRSAMATMVNHDTIPRWTPHRVYDTDQKRWVGFEDLAARAATADVVFLGEQHDDPGTHAMERALVEAIVRRRPVVLSMEMFERDVQPVVDAYLAGRLPEDSLMAEARPWPRYATDYRPAVVWAKAHGWPVIAANVPRPVASAVARQGLAAIDSLGEHRGWAAAEFGCNHDDYFDKFRETMAAHVPGDDQAAKDAAMERYFQSQCVKDETMAESIVAARRTAGPTPIVVHLNGAFHSDYTLGTAARVKRRMPAARVMVISAIPVQSLDGIDPSKDDRKKGDWLLYTLAPAKAEAP